MPFKLPNYPSPKATPAELADFAEVNAMLYNECSAQHIQAHLGRIEDNQEALSDTPRIGESYKQPEGPEDADDITEQAVTATLDVVRERTTACNGGYPFYFPDNSFTLIYRPDHSSDATLAYEFLLLATRLNMSSQKVFEEIDGTLLMENLCEIVLKNYLGSSRTRTMVFGTAAGGCFESRVNALCTQIGEGISFETKDKGRTSAQDDGLDIVGWIPFADGLECKLSVFGQCKTGTKWDDKKTELQPEAFLKRWTRSRSFANAPIRSWFVAEAQNRDHWYGTAVYTGLFFDRCRIVDYTSAVPESLRRDMQTWITAAKESLLAESWSRKYY